ncbi:MAG: hypothetical protein U5L09_20890 [Bacteroidales bacterium]|nr:hypothetical protein [Bacteroidales bacterium]
MARFKKRRLPYVTHRHAFVYPIKVVASAAAEHFFRHHQIILPEKKTLNLLAGMFYNIFLPGGISGDGYKIDPPRKKQKKSLKSTLYGRIY